MDSDLYCTECERYVEAEQHCPCFGEDSTTNTAPPGEERGPGDAE